jgi:betaine-aldehyde dehydrogenase
MTMIAQPKASHFVNGAYVDDATGTALPVVFPGTGEEIARLHEATPAVVEAALAAAKAAQGPGPR